MNDSRMSLLVRRQAHALLGALLVEGFDAERLKVARSVPELAGELPPSVDLDELAAQHYALLGHELPPYAGVFVGDDGLVGGGRPAVMVRTVHQVLGVECPADPGPDHLGQMLRLLAVLADAQLDAMEHGDAADLRTLAGWQRRVLDEAVLPWMPPLHAALGGQPPSVWTRVLELAIGVLGHQRAEDPSLPRSVPLARGDVSAETVLDEPRTSLRTVAEILTTPVRSGVYLTRRDLDTVARRCELPRGFGGRRDTMEKLLRAAAEYDAMPRLVQELRQLWATRDDAYVALGGEAGLGLHVPGWRQRVAGTRRLLTRLGDAARSGDGTVDDG